jgi:hypothetical protein
MCFISEFVDDGFDLSISLSDHFLTKSLLELFFLLVHLTLVLLHPLLLRDLVFFLKPFDFVCVLSLELLRLFIILLPFSVELLLYSGIGVSELLLKTIFFPLPH